MAIKRTLNKATTIYKLLDPVTRQVGYVGQTIDPHQRKLAHRRSETHDWDSPDKVEWIRSVRRLGREPEFVVIQEAPGLIANKVEAYWISYYLRLGHPISNCVPKIIAPFPRAFALPRQVRSVQMAFEGWGL